MHKKVTLEKPIPIIFSIIAFALLIAGLLALQNIFNGDGYCEACLYGRGFL